LGVTYDWNHSQLHDEFTMLNDYHSQWNILYVAAHFLVISLHQVCSLPWTDTLAIMADPHEGQYPQNYGCHGQPPPNQLQLLPQNQATHPPGEAQNDYDQNQSFDSNSYDDYNNDDQDDKSHEEDGDEKNSRHEEHPKKHHRKRRPHSSSRPSPSEYYSPKLSIGQSAANVHQPTLKPGITGTIKGLYDLARKKPYVHADTVERMELLRRADRFFNSGFVGRFGRLNKEKAGWFWEEMDRVSRVLRNSSSDDVEGSFWEGKVRERGHVGFEMPSEGDGRSKGARSSNETGSSANSRSSHGIRSSKGHRS
jgi:hypothetical protein